MEVVSGRPDTDHAGDGGRGVAAARARAAAGRHRRGVQGPRAGGEPWHDDLDLFVQAARRGPVFGQAVPLGQRHHRHAARPTRPMRRATKRTGRRGRSSRAPTRRLRAAPKIAEDAEKRGRTVARLVEAYAADLPKRRKLRGAGQLSRAHVLAELAHLRAAVTAMGAADKAVAEVGKRELQTAAARHRRHARRGAAPLRCGEQLLRLGGGRRPRRRQPVQPNRQGEAPESGRVEGRPPQTPATRAALGYGGEKSRASTWRTAISCGC